MEQKLASILNDVWVMLARGTRKTQDPFRIPVMGTSRHGECRQRAVILRRVDRHSRLLICHSDVRADKIEEIRESPSVSWLFYNPKKKIQVRAEGRGTVHTVDEVADREWASTTLFNRLHYLGEAPGQVKEFPSSGLPAFLKGRAPTEEESRGGRENFAVISTTVERLDWLELGLFGHQRALFIWTERGGCTANWITP